MEFFIMTGVIICAHFVWECLCVLTGSDATIQSYVWQPVLAEMHAKSGVSKLFNFCVSFVLSHGTISRAVDFFSFQQEVLLYVDIVCLQKKPVYMLPFLVLDLIGLVILVPGIFIAGIIATMHNWEIGLIVLVIGSVIVGKYYYSCCHIREWGWTEVSAVNPNSDAHI